MQRSRSCRASCRAPSAACIPDGRFVTTAAAVSVSVCSVSTREEPSPENSSDDEKCNSMSFTMGDTVYTIHPALEDAYAYPQRWSIDCLRQAFCEIAQLFLLDHRHPDMQLAALSSSSERLLVSTYVKICLLACLLDLSAERVRGIGWSVSEADLYLSHEATHHVAQCGSRRGSHAELLPELLGLQTLSSSGVGCFVMGPATIKGPCASKLVPLQSIKTLRGDNLSQLWPAAASSIPAQATRNNPTHDYATSW